MENTDKISVLIPVYNGEKYLKECLDSVVNQTYGNLEIICINDGSTDSTKEILEKYKAKDNRIKVFHQDNIGNSKTRNRLLEKVETKYFMFLDADDYMETDIIEKLYKTIVRTDTDFVVSSVNVIKSGNEERIEKRAKSFLKYISKLTPTEIYQITPENFSQTIMVLHCLVWGRLYRTDFIKNNNICFYDGNTVHDDEGFNIKIMSNFPKFSCIEDIGVNYRITFNSISEVITRKENINQRAEQMVNTIIDAQNYVKAHCKPKDIVYIYAGLYRKYKQWMETDLYKTKNKQKGLFYKKYDDKHIIYCFWGIKIKKRIHIKD